MSLGKEKSNHWMSVRGCFSTRPPNAFVSMASNRQRPETWTSQVQVRKVTATVTCSTRHERGGDWRTGLVTCTVEFWKQFLQKRARACVCGVDGCPIGWIYFKTLLLSVKLWGNCIAGSHVVEECRACPQPYRKISGNINKPRRLYCCMHVTCVIHKDNHYQCPSLLTPALLGANIFIYFHNKFCWIYRML